MFKNDSFFKKLNRFDTFKYLKIKLSIYTRQRTINGFIKMYFYTTKTKIQWYQNFCINLYKQSFRFLPTLYMKSDAIQEYKDEFWDQ